LISRVQGMPPRAKSGCRFPRGSGARLKLRQNFGYQVQWLPSWIHRFFCDTSKSTARGVAPMSTGTVPAKLVSTNPQDASIETRRATGGLKPYFAFFFLSGFCSLMYELIWLRLAMAQFGVTSPMISIVLSSFMAGLGLGSWVGGRLIRKHAHALTIPPLQLYAVIELLIGCSAVVVPLELLLGRFVLEHLGASLSLSSAGYYIAAGFWTACTLIPWCACMGATIPLAMLAIRTGHGDESKRSFSFLYLANVFGAVAGTLIQLLLVELWGFNRTLQCGMLLNVIICAAAFRISKRNSKSRAAADQQRCDIAIPKSWREMLGSSTLWLLFATGLTSMGMEVVWTRQFTIYVGTLVYSFATILGVYLAATFLGSMIYRWRSRTQSSPGGMIWLSVCVVALLPLLTADPRVSMPMWLRLPLGIAGFSGLLGFLTPKLVDHFSEGDPDRAGLAYAVNIAGCILGPLVAGFLLLPYTDERMALAVLTVPWFFAGFLFTFFGRQVNLPRFATSYRAIAFAVVLLVVSGLIFRTQSYVERVPGAKVLRDNTATVLAVGQGMQKALVVNGITMTSFTPTTKVMADVPLALLDHAPQNALVICFGMGTTHRSVLSWGIDSTAVDLVPSVPAMFPYYYQDSADLMRSPRSHIVIDDGRRFLERTSSQYDVIAIDPPPPIGAAGSSLLYSREFYRAAKKRLRAGGILAQWYPGGDRTTTAAIARALHESFPFIRAFGSYDSYGVHFMASMQPIPTPTAAEMAQRMPMKAAADFVEWGPYPTAEQQFAALLKKELPIEWLISFDKNAPALQDDRPINEYALLRSLGVQPY
jgi:spermidine synthase